MQINCWQINRMNRQRQYQKALQLKPEEKYPKDRIAEIDLALADLAKQKALDDQYNAAIAKADKLLQQKPGNRQKPNIPLHRH